MDGRGTTDTEVVEMEMSRGIGDNVAPITVAVAVKSAEGKGSQRAVRWAVENLLPKANCLLLVHVMPNFTVAGDDPTKETTVRVSETYIQNMKEKCEEFLLKFKFLYGAQKIQTLILEGNNVAFTLVRFISDSRTSILVLGSGSSNSFMRKIKDSKVPSTVFKHAPNTCRVHVVFANKHVSTSRTQVLITGQDINSDATRKQESCTTSSSMISKFSSCLSDIKSVSQEHTQGFSSLHSGSVQDSSVLISEDGISYRRKTEGSTSIPSEYSKQPDIQTEVERMRLELKNKIALYNSACEDLVQARSEVQILSAACIEEAQKIHVAQKREERFRIMASKEREKYLEAEKEVEMAKMLLEKEAFERKKAELKAREESLEKQKIVDALHSNDPRYRRYTSDEIQTATSFFSESNLIGEGGFGKVYRCILDNTLVAIKVLRVGASARTDDFLREVEVLSQLRHPHVVLLLGACPESGSLVYEYMACGSLEDHILRKGGKTPLPLFSRFRIAFEVACGLAFLHSFKPEPIVHRDLKPGNILLDKHLVSKIGDVGLAKTIYNEVPDNVTEYNDSVIAGTQQYIDPEYHRTGTLRTKSDLFSFGVIILQLLSGSHPNGIIKKFEIAMGNGTVSNILDTSVADWPLSEARELADVALKCCRLRCRDRPDLETEVLPTLKRLAEFADSSMVAPRHYYCPIRKEVMKDPYVAADGFTYEHAEIKVWVEQHDTSPVTKQKLQHKMLTPNHALHSAIEDWKRQANI